MKRVLSLILCVVMVLGVAACFAGCGDDGKKAEAGIAGRYNLETMAIDGTEISIKDLMEMAGDEAEGLEFYLELKADGTAVMNMGGDIEELVYKDGQIWPEGDEDDKISFTVKGNTLTLEEDGEKLVFKK